MRYNLPVFKCRASAAHLLLVEPREKNAKLSKTTIGYLKEWAISQLYGIEKDLSNNKYIRKGVECEDIAIEHAIEWLDLPMVLKNEKFFENDFFTGTPDIIMGDEILDIKNSYDPFTFPLFENNTPEHEAQMQVYMELTGKSKAWIVKVLENDPFNENYNYDNLETELRIKTFEFAYNPEFIRLLEQKVILCREFIDKNF